LYLVAIMDWATRKVLAWRLSNNETLSAIGPRTMVERVLREPKAVRFKFIHCPAVDASERYISDQNPQTQGEEG
jgi:hypothetical protein